MQKRAAVELTQCDPEGVLRHSIDSGVLAMWDHGRSWCEDLPIDLTVKRCSSPEPTLPWRDKVVHLRIPIVPYYLE